VFSVSDFLKRVPAEHFQNRYNLIFDYAIAQLLLSNHNEGLAALIRVKEAAFEGPNTDELRDRAKAADESFKSGRDAFERFVANCEANNANLLFPKLALTRS
jgi:hypothetical protein